MPEITDNNNNAGASSSRPRVPPLDFSTLRVPQGPQVSESSSAPARMVGSETRVVPGAVSMAAARRAVQRSEREEAAVLAAAAACYASSQPAPVPAAGAVKAQERLVPGSVPAPASGSSARAAGGRARTAGAAGGVSAVFPRVAAQRDGGDENRRLLERQRRDSDDSYDETNTCCFCFSFD